jgi:hypothetical protein
MRGVFASIVAIAAIAPSMPLARSDEIPTLDIRPVCRGIANQSADPGIGQGGQAATFQRCIESERAVRDQIKKEWPAFSAVDKQHCVTLAKTGGESSNTELLTCLEMSRDVRALRSEEAVSARRHATEPASSPSMMLQPSSSEAASQPAPAAESPKTDGDLSRKEVGRPNKRGCC